MEINKNLNVMKTFLSEFNTVNDTNINNTLNTIINTMDAVGCFDKNFFSITKSIAENKTDVKEEDDVNKNNFFTKFNNANQFLNWFVTATQIKFFQRGLNVERWETNFSPELLESIDNAGFTRLNLFNKSVDFNGKKNNYICILGSTYASMKLRLEYLLYNENKLKNLENRLQKVKERIENNLNSDGKILFLTGSRKINLSQLDVDKNSIEEIDNLYKDNKEVSVSYRFLKNKFLQENNLNIVDLENEENFTKFKEFVKQNKENITEVEMADYLINEQDDYVKEKLTILNTEKSRNIARNRVDTGDTFYTFLEKNKKIGPQSIITSVSGQPNIVSQREQIKSVAINYDNVNSNNLNVIGKGEATTFSKYVDDNGKIQTKGNLKGHIQTFAGTLFALYPYLKCKINNEEVNKENYNKYQEERKDFNYDLIKNKYKFLSLKCVNEQQINGQTLNK